jgi:hypothetical protein
MIAAPVKVVTAAVNVDDDEHDEREQDRQPRPSEHGDDDHRDRRQPSAGAHRRGNQRLADTESADLRDAEPERQQDAERDNQRHAERRGRRVVALPVDATATTAPEPATAPTDLHQSPPITLRAVRPLLP